MFYMSLPSNSLSLGMPLGSRLTVCSTRSVRLVLRAAVIDCSGSRAASGGASAGIEQDPGL